MENRTDGKAEETVTSPTSPQKRKPYGAVSIITPFKKLRDSQTRTNDVTPAQSKQALKDLVFTFANANADSSSKNVSETIKTLNAYVERHSEKTSKIRALPYLTFISEYAEEIAYPEIPKEQDEFASNYVNALLSEKKIETKNGEIIQSPLIKSIPTTDEKKVRTEMVTLFIGIYGRLYQNITRAIDAFEKSLQDTTRRILFPESPPLSKAATQTPPKPRKLSPWKKLKSKWKKLSRGWKIFAGVVIGLCSLCIIITALVCPASLIITIPIVGKCAVKTLIMASAGAVATVTMTGHSIHISFTKMKMNNEGEEQATTQRQGDSTDPYNSDNVEKSGEHVNEQLSEDEQRAISNAIESTVRGLMVAGTNGIVDQLAEREAKQREEGERLAASSDHGSPPSSSRATTQTSSKSGPSLFGKGPAGDALRPMREEQVTRSPGGQRQATNEHALRQGPA